MAKRQIRISTDEVLRKICKPVKEITPNTLTLLDDMAETMYDANGVGLAAPQVGVLKRIVVIDIGDGLVELINPVIVEATGSQIDSEGCRSGPGARRRSIRRNCHARNFYGDSRFCGAFSGSAADKA